MPAPKGHPPYNKNGEGGRPKKYTEEFINNEADALIEWMKDKNNIFIEDFVDERDLDPYKISDMEKCNERFNLAYARLKNKQKVALFKGGLFKKFNSNVCTFMLGCNHGLYAKTEQTISTNQNDPFHIIISNCEGNSSDLVSNE